MDRKTSELVATLFVPTTECELLRGIATRGRKKGGGKWERGLTRDYIFLLFHSDPKLETLKSASFSP